jgi:spore coat polysaccharide biosynthesis predicted glycosyltransferase SpsG
MIDVFLICFAGEGIGKGHLTRILSIYQKIKKSNIFDIEIVIQGESFDKINNFDTKTTLLSNNQSLSNYITSLLDKTSDKIFILDIKEDLIDENFENSLLQIQNNKGIIISIDSLLTYEKFIDFYFMPTFHKQDKFDIINKDKISWGWSNFLLNSKYSNTENKNSNKNIIILTGGSDATNLGQTLPQLIDSHFQRNETINWIIGPYSKSPNLSSLKNNKWNFIKNPQFLDDYMLESKIAITVFGVSFFELLYYGIPTIVFSPYGVKDNEELMEIEKLGIAIVAKTESEINTKLNQLYDSEITQKNLSLKSRNLLATKGQEILYNQIITLINRKWGILL